MKWLLHPCRHHAADLDLLATGGLPEADRAGLERHLQRCSACRARLAELKILSDHLTCDGQNLPPDEPPASMRRHWMRAVRNSARTIRQPESPLLPAWLTGRRLAWSGIAAMWMLSLFFRFSAPDISRPAVTAMPAPSLRQLLIAFRPEPRGPSLSAPVEPQPQNQPAAPRPPRTERPELPATRRTQNNAYHENTLA